MESPLSARHRDVVTRTQKTDSKAKKHKTSHALNQVGLQRTSLTHRLLCTKPCTQHSSSFTVAVLVTSTSKDSPDNCTMETLITSSWARVTHTIVCLLLGFQKKHVSGHKICCRGIRWAIISGNSRKL